MFGDAELTGTLLARLAAVRGTGPPRAPDTKPSSRTESPDAVRFGVSAAEDAASAYLSLLDRILEDRRITDAEVHRLADVAADWGIGALEAAWLHRRYMEAVWQRVCDDETVTPEEFRDVVALAALLGVPLEILGPEGRNSASTRRVAVPVEGERTVVARDPGRIRVG